MFYKFFTTLNFQEKKHKVCLKMLFSCKFSSKDCSRALIKPKQMTQKSKWVHKTYWKIIEHKCTNSENQSPGNGAFLQMHIKKRSFGLNQTFVVQVEVSSKPCYRTLKLFSRYFKPKSFTKSPTSCMSQQIWLYSSESNYMSKVKFWTSAKTTSRKKLVVDKASTWAQRHSEKSCDFKNLIRKKFEFKLPNVNEINYCLVDWARTTEWDQSKVSG